tara:strand:+ start:1740 stop:2780 length:1041 start_codon:yes stop_codon:yes gene_type:complete
MIKLIKYFIKFLKTNSNSYEASPITKLNQIKHNDILLSINTKNKTKDIFYIIKRTPGAGLFSNFIFVLNHIKIADSLGYKPIIDMENFPTIYNEKKSINKTKNAWNYYFDNKKNYNLKKILKNHRFIITSNRFSKSFSHTIDNNQFRMLFKKYFKINNNHLRFVEKFKKKFFINKKIVALHLRGTSNKTSANHPFPITEEQTINVLDKLIKKNKYDKIFLCTEDLNYFNLIKRKFKNKIIFLNKPYRSYKDDAFKRYPRKFHRYKLGKDILIEALLISKCDSFIYTNSNVSKFVKFLDDKKVINYFLIENGFNSSNAYIAKWLWYFKAFLPPLLGGFTNTTYVKKN